MGDVIQPDLFGHTPTPTPRLEVHEHSFISGPRSNRGLKLRHSHEGGHVPHSHPETGPAAYTIDKDDWYRATGMDGGGRKEFTHAPTGEQFEFIPRTAEETTFEVIGFDPPSIPPGFSDASGGGIPAMFRMIQAFRMKPRFRVIPGGKGRHG